VLVFGILILIIVYILFFKGSSKEGIKPLISRVERIEKRMSDFEEMESRLSSLEEQLDNLMQSIPNLDVSKIKKRRYHVVRRGETLSQISEKYNLTVNELCRVNKITPKSLIRPGQKLIVSKNGTF
jgi:LysM repeat protein